MRKKRKKSTDVSPTELYVTSPDFSIKHSPARENLSLPMAVERVPLPLRPLGYADLLVTAVPDGNT